MLPLHVVIEIAVAVSAQHCVLSAGALDITDSLRRSVPSIKHKQVYELIDHVVELIAQLVLAGFVSLGHLLGDPGLGEWPWLRGIHILNHDGLELGLIPLGRNNLWVVVIFCAELLLQPLLTLLFDLWISLGDDRSQAETLLNGDPH